MDPDRWFHGKITRENAAHLVSSSGPSGRREGLFVVRESTRVPGSYVLTMWARGQVHHFQIVGHGDGWFSVDNGPLFQGLDDLVHHYQIQADGLPAQLHDYIIGNAPPLVARKRLETELHKATVANDLPAVLRVISQTPTTNSGTVDSQNNEGVTPIHEASRKGYNEILNVLLQQKPDVTIRDSKGATALHLAARNGHAETARLLVEKGGADVQERNATTGWVALHEAGFRGHVDVCQILLHLNAPLRPRTPDEDTPRDLAIRYKQKEVIKLLDWATHDYPRPRTTTAEWLHKVIDRNTAVHLLQKRGLIDGSFVVRPNSRRPGYYALTLVYNQMPYHYEIVCESDRWYFIDDGPLFDSLPAVIEHYMLFTDGLPTLLRFSVPPGDNTRGASFQAKAPPPGQVLFAQVLASKPSKPQAMSPVSTQRQNLQLNGEDVIVGATATSAQGGPKASPRRGAKDNYEMMYIRKEDLKLKEELGQGEFGSVLRGTYKGPSGKIEVAIKTLRVDAMGHGEQEFMREAKIMFNLNHPCIVKLIGVTRSKPMMMVQELIPLGALVDYLYDGKYKKPTMMTLKLWAAEIASGMMYLEKRRFVHRDLAARNILVHSESQVKISDFGLSRAVGAHSNYYKASQGGRWPVKWYAPESINYGTFSSSSDVWSYGVTLWEMFSYGDAPYGEMTGADVLDMVENHNYRLSRPEGCPESIYQLMLSCWSLDPTQRPTFAQLHQAFSEDPEYRDVPHKELYQCPGDL